jgi:hypothetical protein
VYKKKIVSFLAFEKWVVTIYTIQFSVPHEHTHMDKVKPITKIGEYFIMG